MSDIILSRRGGLVELRLGRFLEPEAFAKARDIEGAMRFDRENRCAVVPLAEAGRLVDECNASGLEVEVTDELVESMRAEQQRAWADAGFAVRGSRDMALYDFQRLGVAWLAGRSTGLLADEMGLGKTRQALAALPPHARALIVCPAFVRGVWVEEARVLRPDFEVWENDSNWAWPEEGELRVTSYDMLRLHAKGEIPEGLFLVFDEAHYLKHFSAARTKRAADVVSRVQERGGRVWMLTGTPITSSPLDAWTLARILGVTALGSRGQFIERMGGTRRMFRKNGVLREGGWDFSPSEEAQAWLRGSLSRFMLRRLRKDVLPQLPDRTYRDILVDVSGEVVDVCDRITKSERWNRIPENAAAWKASFGDELMTAREMLARAKIPAMLEVVKSFGEQGEPLVVFSAHRAPIEAIRERCQGWGSLLGGEFSTFANACVENFQNGEGRGFATTIGTGGTGITLHRACHALFVDLDWTPANNDQAEARLLRIGQKNAVVIHRLVARVDLERRLWKLLSRKERLIEGALGAS